MTRIDQVIDLLDLSSALHLGHSPWSVDLDYDQVDVVQVDWSKLFPSKRPTDKGNYDWEIYGDQWDLNSEEFEDILDTSNISNEIISKKWDTCAWYQPIHYFGYDWGIYVKEDCLRNLARQIYINMYGLSGIKLSRPSLLIKALIRTAFSIYYHHELYHHKIECFGLRSHAILKKSIYSTYHSTVYRPNSGTDNQLEEALANAFMYRALNKSTWVPPSLAQAAREHLNSSFPHNPPSYRLAPQYIKDNHFERGQHSLYSQIQEASLVTSMSDDYWTLAPRINHSFINIRDDIWTIVPRGRKTFLPSIVAPLKTCSTNQMVKICQTRGYEITEGGKGSHLKLKKPGSPTLILPGDRDNLSPGVAKNILASIGNYKINDLQKLI